MNNMTFARAGDVFANNVFGYHSVMRGTNCVSMIITSQGFFFPTDPLSDDLFTLTVG